MDALLDREPRSAEEWAAWLASRDERLRQAMVLEERYREYEGLLPRRCRPECRRALRGELLAQKVVDAAMGEARALRHYVRALERFIDTMAMAQYIPAMLEVERVLALGGSLEDRWPFRGWDDEWEVCPDCGGTGVPQDEGEPDE